MTYDQRRKMRAAQALADGAQTPGERQAALAAIERLRAAEPKVKPTDEAETKAYDALMRDAEDSLAKAFARAFPPDGSMQEARLQFERRAAMEARFFNDLRAKVGQEEINEVMADIERCKAHRRK